MIKVAIIDDGMFAGLADVYYEVVGEGDIIQINGLCSSEYTHGSICGEIFRSVSPHAYLISLKIIQPNQRTNVNNLYIALKWCIDNDIKIVSVSLGTTNLFMTELIEKVCKEADQKGIIIVGALNNNHRFTVPASLKTVVGVEGYDTADKGCFANKFRRGDIDFRAHGTFMYSMGDGTMNFLQGNSFATPRVAAMLYNLVEQDMSLNRTQAVQKLYNESKGYFTDCNCSDFLFDIPQEQSVIPFRFFKKHTDIPVIAIENADIDFLSMLKTAFGAHEYYSLIIADNKHFYKGVFPISEKKITAAIAYVAAYYNADIILCSLHNEKKIKIHDKTTICVNKDCVEISNCDRNFRTEVKMEFDSIVNEIISLYKKEIND